MDRAENRTDLLRPYLPRLLTNWLAEDPEASFQRLSGSLAFVDISGFTRLSERLARKGKVGAEELTTLLGSCFTRLLAEAYGNEGSLIKFGGDALLLFFAGDDHEARAARAAVGMRATLRQIGRLETTIGRVTLRMSVGLHSGQFHFFLVGTSHRELILTGPAATTTVLMERAAQSGEILVSDATAAALPAGVLGAVRAPGHLLRHEPPGLSPGIIDTEPNASAVDLSQAVPLAIREHLFGGGGGPEHRRVSVAFFHFQGLDSLLEMSGPGIAAKVLHELVSVVQEAVDQHQITFLGTDIDADGGKIILTAGAPSSTGNDEERMLRALRQIIEGNHHLPIHIGVNRGQVFSGDIGPPYRRTYTVMGDAVNLAARLMAKADPGQILASLPVLERSRTTFETKELEPFFVKGKAQPIQAAVVGPIAGARRVESAELGPLFGRAEELKILLETLQLAVEGRGTLVELVGEPGIGKSRLVEELKAQADDVRTFSLVCDQYESSTPYFPFRLLMRVALGISAEDRDAGEKLVELVEETAPHLMPWLPLVAIPAGVNVPPTPEVDQLDEQFRRPRLHEAVGELLARVLSGPTLLVFEDAHWMDEASGDLVSHLLRGLEERPWMICATRRDQATGFVAPDDRGFPSIRLKPLSGDDAAALAWARTEGVQLAPHEIELLAQRSGGNPLFLLELVGGAQATGDVEALPDSVDALIMARIDRLAPVDRTLLRYAAVLGMAFGEDLLMAVLPPEVLAGGDGSMWERMADFLEKDHRGVFRFRHGLIREVAYEGLPYRRRRELHAHAGGTIERACKGRPDEEAEILSLHFFNSGAFDKAWRYSRAAGGRAQAQYANVEAAVFYERALQAAKRIGVAADELASVYDSLGDVKWRMGAFRASATAYAASRRLYMGNPIAQVRVLLKEAKIPYKAGRLSQSIRWVRRGMAMLDGLAGEDAMAQYGRLAAWYASIRTVQGRYAEAERWCRRLIEAKGYGAREVLARAYYVLDVALEAQGRLQEAINSPKSLSIFEELGDLQMQGLVLNNMGTSAYFRGNWDQAIDLWERGREIQLRLGDADSAALGTNNVGEIRSDQGRLDEAEQLFREVLRLSRAEGHRSLMAFALSNLGRVSYRAGRYDEALDLLERAKSMFQEIEEHAQVLETDARIAELHVFRRDWRVALSFSAKTLAAVETAADAGTQIPMLHRVRGYALTLAGRIEEARTALEMSLRAGRAREAIFEIALTLEAMAELAEIDGGTPDPALRSEGRSILDRLGVLSRPGFSQAVESPVSAQA